MADFDGFVKKVFNKKDTSSDGRLPESSEGSIPNKNQDTQELIQAKEKVLEEMRELERKIHSERDAWALRRKEKDEERISIEAQLELIEKRAGAEKQKRELELGKSEEETLEQLKRLEKQIELENEIWSKRLEDKENELKNESNNKLMLEAQKKIEEERVKQEYEAQISDLIRDVESKERLLLESRAQFIQKLKQQDEANVNLRTRLSLKQTQLNAEWEAREQDSKKLQEEFENKQKELARELASKIKSFEQNVRVKEAEIVSLKGAIQQKKYALDRDMEEVERKLIAEKDKVVAKIGFLKKCIADENTKWADVIKAREDEYNGLKTKLLLEDAQEKADWEKRKNEIAEISAKARSKIEFLKRSIEQEEDKYKQELQKKEEIYEALKIQYTIQSQELEAQWQKKLEEKNAERIKLESSIVELQNEAARTREYWEAQVKLKEKEAEALKQSLEESLAKEAAERDKLFLEINAENEGYSAKAASLENELRQNKLKWEEQIGHKNSQLAEVENAINQSKAEAQNSIGAIEKEFSKKNKPLIAQLEAVNDEITAIRQKSEELITEKEKWMGYFKAQFERQEEVKRSHFEEQKNLIQIEKSNLEQRIRNLISRQTDELARYQHELSEKEQTLKSLKDELARNQQENKFRLDEFTADMERKKLSLEREIEGLKEVSAQENTKLNAIAAEKAKEREAVELEAAEKLKAYEKQLRSAAEVWETEKNKYEAEILKLEGAKKDDALKHAALAEEKDASIKDIAQQIELEKQFYEAEADKRKASYSEKIEPLEQARLKITEEAQCCRSEHENRIRALNNTIALLEEEKKSKEEIFDKKVKNLAKGFEQEKNKLLDRIEQLKRDKNSFAAQSVSALDAKNKELESKNNELDALRREHRAKLDELSAGNREIILNTVKAIEQLSYDYDELKRKFPAVLEAKSNELKKLRAEVSEIEAKSIEEEENNKRKIELLKAQMSSSISASENELAAVKKEYELRNAGLDEEFSRVTSEVKAAEDEYNSKLQEVERDFGLQQSQYSVEKDKLQQQILLEENKNKEETQNLSKQIEDLKRFLQVKKDDWEREAVKARQYYEQEASNLSLEERRLKLLAEEEKNKNKDLIKNKLDQLNELKLSTARKLSELKLLLEEKKRDSFITLERFRNDIAEQKDFWEKQKQIWAKRVEARNNELDKLKQEYSNWESNKNKAEEQKRNSYEREIHGYRESIRMLESKIEEQKKAAVAQLSVKEEEIKNIQEEFEKNEAVMREQSSAEEAMLVEEKEKLIMEMNTVEERLRQLEETQGAKLKSLQNEEHKLQIELNEKRTALELDFRKTDREFIKLKHQFEAKKRQLQKELAESLDKHNFQLKLKDEDIATLKMRVKLRQERLESEWKRREEALSDVVEKLKIDLESAIGRKEELKEDFLNRIMLKERSLILLKDDLENTASRYQDEQKNQSEDSGKNISEYNDDLIRLEAQKALSIENLKIESGLKEEEIKELNKELIELDKRINEESLKSRELYHQSIVKADSIRQEFNREVGAAASKQFGITPAKRSFEKGVKLYSQGLYEEAVGAFGRTIELDPSFTNCFQYTALCYLHLGLIEKALEYGSKALEADPSNETLKSWLADVSKMSGE